MDPDLDLMTLWRAGDKGAGEALFHRHFGEVLRFFHHKVWEKAEDLTQQTFLECLGSRDRFRGDSTFRTYLFAIAWNQLRQHFRKELQNEHLDFEVSSVSELAGVGTSPSGKVNRAQHRVLLQQALSRLPLNQQTLLEYHYWQDLDAAALAEIFGVPTGAIRVRLLRARNALREQLEKLEAPGEPRSDQLDDPLSVSLARLETEDSSFAGD